MAPTATVSNCRLKLASAVSLIALSIAFNASAAASQSQPLEAVSNIIVIYEENRSTDAVLGLFPGANGLKQAGSKLNNQVDENGNLLATLPPVRNTNLSGAPIDPRFPPNLTNGPFDISNPGQGYPGVPQNQNTGDLVHRFYQEQIQIDGGKMDKFAVVSDAKGLALGYYNTSNTYLYHLAQQYTLADNFFHGAFGGSFLNHFWLVCACSPTYNYHASSNPTATLPVDSPLRAKFDSNGTLVGDGSVTPASSSPGPQPKGDFAINTTRSVFLHAPSNTDSASLLPPQTMPNIGDRLEAAGISWAWYGGGYKKAVQGTPDPLFQFHHQPFAYFANNAPAASTPANTASKGPLTGPAVGNASTEAHREAHLKDYDDLVAALDSGNLEKVVFYKPYGAYNLHPGYTDVKSGDDHLRDLMENHILNNPKYDNAVVIITFDEHGGSWDHVPPPMPGHGDADVWGPGTRVPAIIVSKALAKKHYVDHNSYDTTAILKLIEDRYHLTPLGTRDANSNSLAHALVLPTAASLQ